MKSNFDFLKNTDNELFLLIEEAKKLFQDEYLNQAAVQIRIFAEKIALKIFGQTKSYSMSFDDVLNCLKDRIKTQQEEEFVGDLFFIKKLGNKAAHGENILSKDVLEAFERAFEAALNYSYAKNKDESILGLKFDRSLLISNIPEKKFNLVDKYALLAEQNAKELLGLRDTKQCNQIENNQDTLKTKKEKIKENIKKTRKKLSHGINKIPAKKSKKKKNNKKSLLKIFLFLSIVTISLFFLTKMIFFF